MKYELRWISPDGKSGRWTGPFATRQEAEDHAALRQMENGLRYTVEEVPDAPQWKEEAPRWTRDVLRETIMKIDDESMRAFAAGLGGVAKVTKEATTAPDPGSTAAHHVEILRERVKELEEIQKAIHRDLAFALQLGGAMRDAMRTGEWRSGHDRSMANSAIAGWDRWRTSLAESPQGTAKASEAPREGGDSDRMRLEALRWFLEGNEDASLTWWEGEFHAVAEDVAITAPTLLTLADKLG